eukprot:TRINITY_DN2530_c0_g1_i1.p1 TRINITY_DN2530_c0_g1~~TRINITY_DN2530_c0_g1_i1.p1  ORF type:complete len:170 (-),score=30.83 TRINITY_DN2530_c0_g1_i1:135-644(-)
MIHIQNTNTDALRSTLTLSGYTNINFTTESANIRVQAQKPNWEVGAKATFTLKPSATKPASSNVWKISADEDDDVIDEDSLLSVEDKKLPTKSAEPDDCDFGKEGKKKACKNCTCGRADGVMEETTTAAVPAAKSACGNCYLGDAFRCSSCPYAGQPPFKPGEKVLLQL